MKNSFKINVRFFLPILFSSFLFAACSTPEEDPVPVDEVPVLTTSAISSVTPISATGGGTITDDKGKTVTLRGICWSLSNMPTIDDYKTTDGSGTGNFISNMAGLKASVTYFVRAYAVNSAGTGYGNVISFKTPDLIIGNAFMGGKLAYVFKLGDPGYFEGQSHGLICTSTDLSTGAEWGCRGTALSGADREGLGMGAKNTADIVTGCTTSGIAAKLCADLVSGGYSDWYLPSKDELNKLYLNKAVIGGFDIKDYWSSTGFLANNAWYQYFGDGKQDYSYKDYKASVRAVRLF